MTKKVILFTFLIGISFLCTSFSTDDTSNFVKGVVVYDGESDYHIVETNLYYILVEWYGGKDFSRGDIVRGNLHSYGFKEVYVNGNSSTTRIYIENYWGSIDRCYEWLREHDKLKED